MFCFFGVMGRLLLGVFVVVVVVGAVLCDYEVCDISQMGGKKTNSKTTKQQTKNNPELLFFSLFYPSL